jgi:glutamate-1-semialdehyde 2,1-aminomutase
MKEFILHLQLTKLGLLNEGVYIASSTYETWFITDALSYEDLDFTINSINKVV